MEKLIKWLVACISHTGGAVGRLCEAESQVTDLAYRPQADTLPGGSVRNAG
jgi:hypothetical protein